MCVRMLTLTIAVMLVLGEAFADERLPHRYLSSHGHGGLARVVLRGESQARFVSSPTPLSEWQIEEEKGHWLIWCHNDARDRRLYLSFPTKQRESVMPDEKPQTPLVFLSDSAETNSLWEFEIKRKSGSSMALQARTTTGDFKDWFLCVGPATDRIVTSNSGKNGFLATFVSLCREKSEECQFSAWLDGK